MKHTHYYLLTGLENIVSYLSRDHGHNPRYWRRKSTFVFLFSVPPPLPKEPPMKNHPVKKFILARSDGILLARYRDKDWYLTTDPSRACQLPEADAQAVLQSVIPESERFLWTLHPTQEKEGLVTC